MHSLPLAMFESQSTLADKNSLFIDIFKLHFEQFVQYKPHVHIQLGTTLSQHRENPLDANLLFSLSGRPHRVCNTLKYHFSIA